MPKPTSYLESKNHYPILDGLRGVAALMVVAFHIFEAFNGGSRFRQIINHGYLAVDFFFLLSGFVVAYAYDDRWNRMTQWDFYKRRLIRLQPMLIAGTLIGAALFYFQKSAMFNLIGHTPLWKMLLVMLVGFTLIPITPSMDIRGWQEMHPLDGPAWSLFFEYIANLLYALIVRRFSRLLLSLFVLISAFFLVHYLVLGPKGDVIGGWSVDETQMHIGFIRMLYPFFGGLLLCRLGMIIRVKGAFWISSFLLVLIFCVPRPGGELLLWMNGLYESFAIILLFPLIVSIGAGGTLHDALSIRVCKWLGDISYPIYITHYPLIYWFTAWVTDNNIPLRKGLPAGLLLMVTAILIAYASLKWYDEPVREWLRKRFLKKKS